MIPVTSFWTASLLDTFQAQWGVPDIWIGLEDRTSLFRLYDVVEDVMSLQFCFVASDFLGDKSVLGGFLVLIR